MAKRPFVKREPVDSPSFHPPAASSARAWSVVPGGLPLGYVRAQNGQLYWGRVVSRP